MKADVSLVEVWKWKDEIGDRLKSLSIQERFDYFRSSDEQGDKEGIKEETASYVCVSHHADISEASD